MPYINDIKSIQHPSFDTLREVAIQNLEESQRISPWIGLEHGVKLLESDNEMARYLLAYGNMHKEKIDIALNCIPDPTVIFSRPLTIIDWGCGQGLATMCFLDYLSNFHISPNIQKIIFIEPSPIALQRATININQYGYHNIRQINKYLNDVTNEDLQCPNGLVVHFFSNILDIDTVGLEHLHSLITTSIHYEQLFFCVGPQNIGSSRILEFARLFDIQEQDLLAQRNGQLAGRGTISMLVFKLQSNAQNKQVTEIIKVEYHLHRNLRNAQLSPINKLLNNPRVFNNNTTKYIHFYRLLIELERLKSDCKNDGFPYPLNYDDSSGVCKIQIDIENNNNFEKEFTNNRNVQWPKNLNIGIIFILENIPYRLLQYVYQYNDIKNIDITTQLVSVPLNNFYVDTEVANELNITNEILDTIESILSEPTITLDKILSIIKDAVSNKITLGQELQLALSAETPTLSQIHSELKKLETLQQSDLLTSFLNGSLPDNAFDNIYQEELINIFKIDSAQRTAIQKALNSRISVITGPPGTGKTQMILNLIANALIRGKSVLVASKNNKAVDNIKERYDSFDGNHYLLRFGSRDVVSSQVIPYLNEMINRLPNINFSQTQYERIFSQYQGLCRIIKEAKRQLDSIDSLRKDLVQLNENKERLNEEKTAIETEHREQLNHLYSQYEEVIDFITIPKEDLKQRNDKLNIFLSKLNNCKSLFSRLLFRWFRLNDYREQVIILYNTFPYQLQQIICTDVSAIDDEQKLLSLCTSMQRCINQIIQYKQKKCEIENRYSEHKRTNQEKINRNEENIRIKQNYISHISAESLSNINRSQDVIQRIGEGLFRISVNERLKRDNSISNITRYKAYLPDQIPWRDGQVNQFTDIVSNFLQIFLLNSVTSLSIKNSFPLKEELFDMVIIDEASQCDVASALPLIQRTKQLVVVGDPLQLKHITSVNIDEENTVKSWLSALENPFLRYVNYALYDYCNDLISTSKINNRPYVLNYHYRCYPDIIEYSNKFFYQRRLQTELKIRTPEILSQISECGIMWIDAVGKQKNDTKNVNETEAIECVRIAMGLANQYPSITIGIISPFKHQVEEIRCVYNQQNIDTLISQRIKIDTVHKFQGDECDIIIYSLVVTDNSPQSKIRWIDRVEPNLVNVAVTRARRLLYVVGNKNYIRNNSSPQLPLGYLLRYTESLSN